MAPTIGAVATGLLKTQATATGVWVVRGLPDLLDGLNDRLVDVKVEGLGD